MHFVLKSVAGACALALTVAAQGPLAFTSFPTSVTVGKPVPLTYSGGNGSPITIKLKQGPANNLKDVYTITTAASGTSYDWTPNDVPAGTDYALEIDQAGQTNYGTQFAITGGTGSASASSASASSAVSSAVSSLASSIVANVSSSVSSAVAMASASAGSIPMPRNTTMVSPTLTASTTETAAATTTSSTTATTTSGSGTSSSPSPTGAAVALSGSTGFVLSALLAVLYLN